MELENAISAENNFDLDKFNLTNGFKPKSDEEVEELKKELQEQEEKFKLTKRLDLLDEEGDKELAKAIETSRGVVRALIHPYHVPSEVMEVESFEPLAPGITPGSHGVVI